jgi:hypothetical protein
MSGAELAAALAAAARGVVHPLRTDPRWPAFGVEIPPAGCPVLVRDHGHVLSVSCGAQSWQLRPTDPMPNDLAREAREWAMANPTVTTIVDAALVLVPFLENETRDRWTLDIPGGQHVPSEMWLHGSDFDRASVGIFADAIRVGMERSAPMPPSRNLVEACRAVVGFVREQSAAYDRNVAISNECQRLASEMATQGRTWRTTGSPRPNWYAPIATAVFDGDREIARIEEKNGVVVVTRHAEGAVTLESLREGQSYRVRAAFMGIGKGEVLAYLGQYDNHMPHEFRRASGEVISVSEGWLSQHAAEVLALS